MKHDFYTFMTYRSAKARPANPNKEPAAGPDNPSAPLVALVHAWLDTSAEVSIVRSAH